MRPPGGGRPDQHKPRSPFRDISIHALRVEGDRSIPLYTLWRFLFLSTPSGWRATRRDDGVCRFLRISIHALRVEGDGYPIWYEWKDGSISIHALRVEGDLFLVRRAELVRISIHALRVEGDHDRHLDDDVTHQFLSTPSGWRATFPVPRPPTINKFLSTPSGWRATVRPRSGGNRVDISIHALRVEGDFQTWFTDDAFSISIHALRVEGDLPNQIERYR